MATFTDQGGVATTLTDLTLGSNIITYDDANYVYDDPRVWYDGNTINTLTDLLGILITFTDLIGT